MEIKATDYEAKDIMRFMREWCELDQKKFAEKIGKSYRSLQGYEGGTIGYGVNMLLDIARQNDIEIIIRKK